MQRKRVNKLDLHNVFTSNTSVIKHINCGHVLYKHPSLNTTSNTSYCMTKCHLHSAVLTTIVTNAPVCVEPPSSALNKTLPAFDDKRRRLHHGARPQRRSYRSISPARRALSSKPAGRRWAVSRWDRQTRGRMDPRPLHRPCSAYYGTGSVNNNSMCLRNGFTSCSTQQWIIMRHFFLRQ